MLDSVDYVVDSYALHHEQARGVHRGGRGVLDGLERDLVPVYGAVREPGHLDRARRCVTDPVCERDDIVIGADLEVHVL